MTKQTDKPAPTAKAEAGADANKAEAAAASTKAPAAGLVTYHVLRRHDGEGSNEYDTADAIRRGGASAAHRESTRDMRADDARRLVEMGVLSESKPAAAAARTPPTMVGTGRENR